MFRRTGKSSNGKWRLALIGLNLLFLVIALTQLRPRGLYDFFNYYPEKAMLVDVVAQKANLKRGVANYWDAKEITMFSKKGIEVRAVFDDVSLHDHVANDNWYFGKDFDFVVWTKFNDTTLIRKRLKDIRVISDSPKLRLVKTHPFTYLAFVGGSPVQIDTDQRKNRTNETH
jgi:hypothetical protein